MNNNMTITDYDSLVLEKKRQQEILKANAQLLDRNVDDIGQLLLQKLDPVVSTFTVVKKFVSPDTKTNGVVSVGSNLAIDWIAKKIIPSSNPMLRFIVPALLKNYSSHYVGKATPIIDRIKDQFLSWRSKKKGTAA